ncbi:hypothetical protein ACYOEI_36350 [Singulisphaera rosea]
MQKSTLGALSLFAFLVVPFEVFFVFGLYFAPGWANGWPSGTPIHQVWSIGLTAGMVSILATLELGVCGVIGLAMSLDSKRSRFVRAACVAWLSACILADILAAYYLHSSLYAEALAMWPNGYHR